MGLAKELAEKNVKRQQAQSASQECTLFRARRMVALYPQLWDALKTYRDSFCNEYNADLPGALSIVDRLGFEYEVYAEGRPQRSALVHLSSSSDCIEFAVRRHLGLESAPMASGNFYLDLNGPDLVILDVEQDALLSVSQVTDKIMLALLS